MTKNTPARYSPLMVTLHWLTVILIFAAFALGKYSSFLPNDASEIPPLRIHMMLGITTLLVIVIRFVARLRTPRPDDASTGNAFLDGLGKVMHYALYLFAFLMAASGLSLAVQSGLPQTVFEGVGSLPADFFLFTPRIVHGFIAPTLFLLITLHVGAAFYHQLFIKDNLFSRIWYGK